MMEVPCFSPRCLRQGKVCSLLLSSVVSIRGRLRDSSVECLNSLTSKLGIQLIVDTDN